jgi:hypothetical protein
MSAPALYQAGVHKSPPSLDQIASRAERSSQIHNSGIQHLQQPSSELSEVPPSSSSMGASTSSPAKKVTEVGGQEKSNFISKDSNHSQPLQVTTVEQQQVTEQSQPIKNDIQVPCKYCSSRCSINLLGPSPLSFPNSLATF